MRRSLSLHAAALAGSASACLLLLALFSPMTVIGASMTPALPEGSVVLVFKAAYGLPSAQGALVSWARPSSGDVVVFYEPLTGALSVKRCASSPADDIILLGDQPGASIDSRHYGPVAPRLLAGRVIWVLRRGLG